MIEYDPPIWKKSTKTSERHLVEFVLWRMRYRDLPPDIRVEAEALVATYPRPPGTNGITEGPLTVCGFPTDETILIEKRKCFPHQVGQIAQKMLEEGCIYVLVQNLDE